MLRLIGHSRAVRAVAFAADGHLVSAGEDRTVRVWNTLSGETVATIRAGRILYAVAVAPDGQHVAFGGRPATSLPGRNVMTMRSLPAGDLGWDFITPETEYSIWSAAFSGDGSTLAVAFRRPGGANISNGAGLHLWEQGNPNRRNVPEDVDAYAVAFHPTAKTFAFTTRSAVRVFNDLSGPEVRRYKFPADWAVAVAFVPNKSLLIVAASRFVYYADIATDTRFKKVRTEIPHIKALAVSPDGRSLYVTGRPGRVERYSLPRFELVASFDFEIGNVDSVSVAPDSLTVAAGGERGLVVWDAE